MLQTNSGSIALNVNCPSHLSKVLTYLPRSNNLNANKICYTVLHVKNGERFKVHVFRLFIANTSIIYLNEHPVILATPRNRNFLDMEEFFFSFSSRLPFVLWYVSMYSGPDFMLLPSVSLLQPFSSF